MPDIVIPRPPKGRPSAVRSEKFQVELEAFAGGLTALGREMEMKISIRGWCYILESKAGLAKGDFGLAMRLINRCRKTGLLPWNFTAKPRP